MMIVGRDRSGRYSDRVGPRPKMRSVAYPMRCVYATDYSVSGQNYITRRRKTIAFLLSTLTSLLTVASLLPTLMLTFALTLALTLLLLLQETF